jgi:hypothetical protein
MDDATGLITSAILVEEEGTMSSFLGLAETLAGHGLGFSTSERYERLRESFIVSGSAEGIVGCFALRRG